MVKKVSRKVVRSVCSLCLLFVLAACGSSSNSSSGSLFDVGPFVDPESDSSSDGTYALSGTIYVERDSDVDSDVAVDPPNFVQTNNSFAQAQTISNPSTVGGYLSASAGDYPVSFTSYVIDDRDIYEVSLLQGQRINLAVFYAALRPANAVFALEDIDIEMVLRPVSSPGSIEATLQFDSQSVQSFLVTRTDDYYIELRANNASDPVLYSFSISQYLVENTSTSMPSQLQEIKEGEVIIKFKDSGSIRAQAEKSLGAQEPLFEMKAQSSSNPGLYRLSGSALQSSFAFNAGLNIASVSSATLAKLQTWQAIEQLKQRSDVLYAEPNYVYRATAGVTEPEYQQQWNLPMLELPAAWNLSTGAGVNVAVIDTGIATEHIDLVDNLLLDDAYDFISDAASAGDGTGMDSDPEDQGLSYHGSHVAGIIAADGDNNIGITGVAYDAKILPLRVIGVNGEATTFDLATAILYAAGMENASGQRLSNPVDVINLSLGGYGDSEFLDSAIQSAIGEGVIVVAAAGNDSSSALFYPAAYDGVIGVGSINHDKTLSSFSNYGSYIDVVAPGGTRFGDDLSDGFFDGILSTIYASEYAEEIGTSMATPHVAGVAALMKSYNNAVDHSLFQTGLTTGELSDDLGAVAYDGQFGYGLINASKAMSWLGGSIDDQFNVYPSTLGFIGSNSSMTLTLSNPGDGGLDIISISANKPWISIGSPQETVHSYRYPISVNPSLVSSTVDDGQLSITFSIASGSPQVETVQVFVSKTISADDTVGDLFVFLESATDAEELPVIVQADENQNGSYSFSFPEVPVGDYYLRASTNNDFDGFAFDAGEARGAYPFFYRLESVSVVDRAIAGLDFNVEFPSLVQSSGLTTDSAESPELSDVNESIAIPIQ